jgi:hypothetical protein
VPLSARQEALDALATATAAVGDRIFEIVMGGGAFVVPVSGAPSTSGMSSH